MPPATGWLAAVQVPWSKCAVHAVHAVPTALLRGNAQEIVGGAQRYVLIRRRRGCSVLKGVALGYQGLLIAVCQLGSAYSAQPPNNAADASGIDGMFGDNLAGLSPHPNRYFYIALVFPIGRGRYQNQLGKRRTGVFGAGLGF